MWTKGDPMQALLLSDNRISYHADHPAPKAAPGEALIRVRLAGICATDLELVKGYAGFNGIAGHEFVGRVEEAEDKDWIGRRVVGAINLGCRKCTVCLGAGPEHCPRRTVLGIIGKDGVFAEYVTLPLANLLTVPDEVADEEAVFTEPLAAALRIREQARIRPSDRIAVVGPGRLGLLAAQVLRAAGGEVAVFGRNEPSLRLPRSWGFESRPVEEGGSDSFDLVVEATGNEAGLAHSLRLVRPEGTLILKSTFQGQSRIDLTGLVVKEISVIGSRCGPFAPALRLLARREIRVREMIEAEYPLSEGIAAFEHAARPGSLKVLLHP